jgi:hypothetical protein
VPVGAVVVENNEVGAADDLKIVGGAGVSDAEVVGGDVGGLGQLIEEGGVGVVDDLAVAVVLHHDDEDVIEVGNAFGNSGFLSEEGAGQEGCGYGKCCSFLEVHRCHLFWERTCLLHEFGSCSSTN